MTDPNDLGFVTGATLSSTVTLLGARGREELSRLFAIDLLLTSNAPLDDDDVAGLLASPCAIAVGSGPGEVLHGVLSRVWALDTDAGTPRYVARMEPTLSLLGLGRASRLHSQACATSLATQAFTRHGLAPLAPPTAHASAGDYLVATPNAGTVREYAVQYDESDLDFVSRWLERDGIAYWFEHHSHGDVVVLSSDTPNAPLVASPHELTYRGRSQLDPATRDLVWSFDRVAQRRPARAVVGDYSEATPAVALRAAAQVPGGTGVGTRLSYGEHFTTIEEGQTLAGIRAEELAWQRAVFEGRSSCARLRAGHVFALDDHPHGRDGEYLVVSAEWTVGWPVEDHREGAPPTWQPFGARFRAIPRGVRFRPERRTPWPRIHGVLPAHVDGPSDSTLADVDAEGRYRLVLPFVSSSANGQAVSRRVRLAQPLAGAGHGAHAPLRRGTEVLVAHLGGDPDRPVIVGAVPNALSPSPVTQANASHTVHRSASGVLLDLDDQEGGIGP